MEEVGGDGFLIFNSYFDRRYVMEICDGLVPELQRRGLTRKAYAHKHLERQSAGILILLSSRAARGMTLWFHVFKISEETKTGSGKPFHLAPV